MRITAAFALLSLLATQLWAAEQLVMRALTVEHDGEVYQVRLEAVVNVPPDRVFGLLTDYERLDRFNPGIVVAERLEGGSAEVDRVRTVLEGCVLFFCRRLERVETVRTNDQRRITTRLVPEGSDFRSGETRWVLAAVTEGTRLRFRARLLPDFWVPPVIGPWAIERELRSNMRTMLERLKRYGRSAEGHTRSRDVYPEKLRHPGRVVDSPNG
ncbi:SRPBCC family protein [Thiohalorhabdus sp.]|uniref:SRPBCC family protein n=1 Tax=Thiohalorhabdus sp. TaxID=3094134 RepID=UPI002FC38481